MEVRAQEIATEQGFKLLFQSANKDPVIQMNQMQAMISQGSDVLVVNATSVKGQKPMMIQIGSEIPVIYIDTSVPGTGTTSAVRQPHHRPGVRQDHREAFPGCGEVEHQNGHSHRSGHRRVRRPRPAPGLPGRAEGGGLPFEILSEQTGDYQQDKGQVAAENMLAANPDVDLVMGLNDSMTLGAYNVIKGKPAYDNVYVAAAADGQKEGLALIKEGVARVDISRPGSTHHPLRLKMH